MSGKSGLTGMRLQQAASFSPFLLRIPHSASVFWPGCALMKYDGAILRKALEVLCREEPMVLAAGCCGQPSVYLFPELAGKRRQQLLSALENAGTRRIYTACPNCAMQLGALNGIEIIPNWRRLSTGSICCMIHAHCGKIRSSWMRSVRCCGWRARNTPNRRTAGNAPAAAEISTCCER